MYVELLKKVFFKNKILRTALKKRFTVKLNVINKKVDFSEDNM